MFRKRAARVDCFREELARLGETPSRLIVFAVVLSRPRPGLWRPVAAFGHDAERGFDVIPARAPVVAGMTVGREAVRRIAA